MKKYFELLKLSFINRVDYRQELIMSLFIGIIIFSGQAIFWKAIYGSKRLGVIAGFTFKEILAYYLFARIISEIIDSKLGFRLSDIIHKGEISNYLVKPIKFKTWLFFEEAGRMGVDVIFKIGVYLFLFLFFWDILK